MKQEEDVLAGPVAAAVISTLKVINNIHLNDSKKFPRKIKNQLRCEIDKVLATELELLVKKIDEVKFYKRLY